MLCGKYCKGSLLGWNPGMLNVARFYSSLAVVMISFFPPFPKYRRIQQSDADVQNLKNERDKLQNKLEQTRVGEWKEKSSKSPL